MTQEDKYLLLKDLCGRLPYGVILNCCNTVGEKLTAIDENGLINHDYDIDEVKPYLFPMSSMTEEQKNEFDARTFEIMFGEGVCKKNDEIGYGKLMAFDLDFYNKYHLDWRGLIPKGLAIDCTNLNIYQEYGANRFWNWNKEDLIMKLYIARDLNDSLSLFSDKPKLKFINIHGKRIWIGDFVAAVKTDLFPEVTFENSPKEVELKLIEK